MTKILCLFLLFVCVAGCSSDSNDDGSQSLFATPPVIAESEETETRPQPPIQEQPQPVPVPEPDPVPEPEPEPEPVPPHDGARDLVGPKLLKSSIEAGAIDVDVDLDNVALEFDERIGKSDLKVVDRDNTSLRWSRLIEGREVILAKLAPRGKDLEMEQTYSIIGTVEDEHQNARVILITFTTSIK